MKRENKKKKKKILIIDDEENFTLLIKANLEETGRYEVKVENMGARGLDATCLFKPDLILLDIMMPDVGGSEVAYQIRNDANTKDIPIVFLTAAVTKEETASGRGVIGGYPFIAKPASTEKLIVCIEENLPKSA